MRPVLTVISTLSAVVWDAVDRLDLKINRARREAQAKADYEEFLRNWTDGTDHG